MGHGQTAVVIEDDDDIGELTRLLLTKAGFTVHRASDGPSGILAVREHSPILTTLDVQMPGMDGFATARRLREFSQTYLIMVTARTAESDVIAGFEAGADDYLTKPFRSAELLARAEATLRRQRGAAPVAPVVELGTAVAAPREPWVTAAARELRARPAGSTDYVSLVDRVVGPGAGPSRTDSDHPAQAAGPDRAPAGSGVRRCAGLELDPASGQVRLGDRRIQLDRDESDLLDALMVTGRRVRSRADLALALHLQPSVTSYFVKEDDKTVVDQRITGLRRKLGDDGSAPRFIEPVRGVGYRMAG